MTEGQGPEIDQEELQPQLSEQERRNREIEAEFPGIREVFDVILQTGTRDLDPEGYDDLVANRSEFPITAGIAIPDENGKLELMILGTNQTNAANKSSRHAEMNALDTANAYYNHKHLPEGSVLVCNNEPCAGCSAFYLRVLDKNQSGAIIWSVSQDDTRGKGVLLRTATHYNEETGMLDSERTLKPFVPEPPSYHSEDFVRERNPNVRVTGGYRRDEAIAYMSMVDVPEE